MIFWCYTICNMEMEMFLEYITLSSKWIKRPRHKRRLAELHEALTSGREIVAPEAKQRDKYKNIPYPYTADEIRENFAQRVYDGKAQRTPW